MTIKKDFQSYVSDRIPVLRGVVEQITATTITISSKVGRKEFQVPDTSQFTVGDWVKFQGNTYLGKLQREGSGAVYVV